MTDARLPIQTRPFAPWRRAGLLALLLVANPAWSAQRQLDRPPPPPPNAPVESGRPPPPPPPPGPWNAPPPAEQAVTPVAVPAPVTAEPAPVPAAPVSTPIVAGSIADLENKLAEARRSNNTADISAALIRLGDAQLQAGQASRALPLLEEAVNLSSRYNDDRQGREAALLMAKAYLAQDDAGMAETWNKRADQFRERIERQIAPLPEAPGTIAQTGTSDAPVTIIAAKEGDATGTPVPSQARWLWLLLPVCLLLIWAWLRSQRKADDLRNETERLARHQKHLRSAHQTLQQQAEHLRQTATQDALTGALTRQAFANDLAELLHHAQTYGKPVAFFLFDLDHFKSVNDTYGHLAGDIALKMVAGVVRENLESKDLFGRFGGDEFLIACMDGDATSAPVLGEKIRASVRKHALDGHESLREISISVGIAIAGPTQGYDLATLFSQADSALYAAKRAGRNCVRLADAGLAAPPSSEFPLRSLAATPNDA